MKKNTKDAKFGILLTYYELAAAAGRPLATIILGGHGPGPACPVHYCSCLLPLLLHDHLLPRAIEEDVSAVEADLQGQADLLFHSGGI